MKKILIAIVFVAMIVISTTYMNATVVDPGYNPGLVGNTLKDTVDNAWATIIVVVRVVAVACVVFAGLRYMFASANQKADIKQGLIYLAIGATLVFGSTYLITVVVQVFGEL